LVFGIVNNRRGGILQDAFGERPAICFSTVLSFRCRTLLQIVPQMDTGRKHGRVCHFSGGQGLLKMRSNTVKRGLSAISIIGLLLVGFYGACRGYQSLRQDRLINQARHFLAVSDPKNASLCLQRALSFNPNDANACRVMAELAEATHTPSALIWRSRALECNPGSLNDRLALAQTALNARDYATAASTLEGVDLAGKKTVDYHNVAGALAAATGQQAEAEAHFRELARLEPTNVVSLLNIAVLHLQGSNAPAATEARSFLRNLASNPTNAEIRANALRELTLDAMRHGDTNAAIDLSKDLLQQTNSIFTDYLLRLEVLCDSLNPEFKPELAGVQRQAANDPAKVSELASWQANKTSAADVLPWLVKLPKATQTNRAVAIVMAECYADVRDWRGLQVFLGPQDWEETDFIRHSFLAAAWRGQEMGDTAKIEWDQALRGAYGSKQRLLMLLGLAGQWRWQKEAEELLGTIVDQFPGDQRAFQTLAHALFMEGQTRSLLKLYNQAAKLDPSSVDVKNNIAFIALLLDAREFKPHELAREVYNLAPTNSAFANTYALSLLLQKKNADALKVIESLDPRELTNASTAGFYGLALQANGNQEKARHYLEIASKATMLPEQRKLFLASGQ
jgi:tetratricopeptide (TPR) repeat protein